MSKSEKRYFKLFTSLQQGGKEYSNLFRLIEKESDLQKLKETLALKKSKTSAAATNKYLYKVLTNSLLQFRVEGDKTSRLINSFLKARILFEKSLYEEGFSLLQKIKKDAHANEEFVIQLWASQTELYYLSNLNFHTVSERQLVDKQMRIEELLKHQKNIHQHTSLYELLRHRLMYSGEVRTQEQKNKLNDLVVSELHYNANPLADTFESAKIHLLFQSYYFIIINDPKSALKTLFRLNDLLDKNRNRWMDRPIDYLSTIEGILESLLSVKRYKAIQLFLDKLDNIKINTGYFDVMVERVKFIYSTARLVHSGAFEEAAKSLEKYNRSLFRKIHLLDLSKQAEVYLFSAIIYIANGKPEKAYIELNKVLLESRLYYALPIYRTFRLLHLVVHYELNNRDYIDYEIRSLKRTFKGSTNKAYKIEKIVFRFLQMRLLPVSAKSKEIAWNKFKTSFDKCEKDAYESQLLKIFDFNAWIKAKMLRQPFAHVLREKLEPEDVKDY
jgi:hypothetical protein